MFPLLLPAIGAGLGLLGSAIGGNKPQQSITTGDPGLQKYIDQYRTMAGNAQIDPQTGLPANAADFAAATQMYQGAAGQNPMMAMQAMNPYLQAMNPFFDQLRKQAVMQANQQATLQHAFGGTGSDIGAAVAGSQADMSRSQFNYQAFQDAMQRLLQSGQLMSNLPGQRMGLLTPGFATGTQTTTVPQQNNPFMAALGGAATLGGIGGFGKGFGGTPS